jgi:hypothetical protein
LCLSNIYALKNANFLIKQQRSPTSIATSWSMAPTSNFLMFQSYSSWVFFSSVQIHFSNIYLNFLQLFFLSSAIGSLYFYSVL